ncbi:MAG: acetyl-CoA carboxylase biotin carboxylase subunit [Balneolales bacterium]
MANIRKILIANRGEIAVRIIRTCQDLDIKTVAVYSKEDESNPHVLLADESILIGDAPSAESYLVMDKIIIAAKEAQVDAIHPGYGFLSENAEFALLCEKNNIIFIGPSPQTIDMMGDKTRARQLMIKAGIPSPPGTVNALTDTDEAEVIANKIGFPILIKAAAGGGGKGMRIVRENADLKKSIKASKSEAENAFGDGRVYIEKYLESPRHVEVQIIADYEGSILHLFDRDCSIQRRHQKVVEEAPCPFLESKLRNKLLKAALVVAKTCNYTNAGTIEFLVDKDYNYYFLEVNTRLQVEHPVTELVTGTDLVAMQIRIAEKKPLTIRQEDIRLNGHAIECRISAEDPDKNFLPSTGTLNTYIAPSGPGIRVDSGVREGQKIGIYYDPLISKLIAFGENRNQAIQRMKRALKEYHIGGIKTTIPFCQFVMSHPVFQEFKYDTHFVNDHYQTRTPQGNETEVDEEIVAAISASLLDKMQAGENITEIQEAQSSLWWSRRRKS